ncbi:hypothetical protein AA313_de0202637 [Arthrobotrys entomopaga]|nr:hypothetical protein AA313_de0202637 [Arthrobotrys entomopaga]
MSPPEDAAAAAAASLDEKIRGLTVPLTMSSHDQVATACRLPENDSSPAPAPFTIWEVTYINKTFLTRCHMETFIKINDAGLREDLNELSVKIWHGRISFGKGPVNAKHIYHFMLRLIKHCKDCKDAIVSPAIKLLVHWATSFNRPIDEAVKKMLSTKFASNEFLWALFVPGEIIVVPEYSKMDGLTTCAELLGFDEVTDGGARKLQLFLQTVSIANGKYGYHRHNLSIKGSAGVCSMHELAAYPLLCHENPDELKQQLVARGRNFIELTRDDKHHHRQYEGYALSDSSAEALSWDGDRIVIDTKLNQYRSAVPKLSRGHRDSWLDPDKLIEEELLICSATVPAFNLRTSEFGEVAVQRVRPVEWRDLSVGKNVLVSETVRKDLDSATAIAKISFNREESTLILIIGPTGVGKSWTVEVMAEEFKRPLFTISPLSNAHDSPSTWMYELSHRWGALVHLKEPINSMAQSEYSRTPRYYAGLDNFIDDLRNENSIVCVLTTSYGDWLKPEIYRSVMIEVEFGKAGNKVAQAIWSMELAKAGIKFNKKQIEELAQKTQESSYIINQVTLAKRLADSKTEGSIPSMEDFNAAEAIQTKFLKRAGFKREMNHYS